MCNSWTLYIYGILMRSFCDHHSVMYCPPRPQASYFTKNAHFCGFAGHSSGDIRIKLCYSLLIYSEKLLSWMLQFQNNDWKGRLIWIIKFTLFFSLLDFGWVVLRIYVTFTLFQSYHNLEVGDIQYCKRGYFRWGKFGKNVGKTFHVAVYSYFLNKVIWVLFSRGGNFPEEDNIAKNVKITPKRKFPRLQYLKWKQQDPCWIRGPLAMKAKGITTTPLFW